MQKAEAVFGRVKVERMRQAFVERDKDHDGLVSVAELGYLLRAQGLCPTEAQIETFSKEVQTETAGYFGEDKFFELTVRVGRDDSRVVDLVGFFAPYDPNNEGLVSVKVFRSLMENVGEVFSRQEVDEMIRDFAGEDDTTVNYRDFLEAYGRRLHNVAPFSAV